MAFVDESRRTVYGRDIISVGFFVTSSFEAAYECLMNEYREIIRKYSLRLRGVEIKFSTLLHGLAMRLGRLDVDDINTIFSLLSNLS